MLNRVQSSSIVKSGVSVFSDKLEYRDDVIGVNSGACNCCCDLGIGTAQGSNRIGGANDNGDDEDFGRFFVENGVVCAPSAVFQGKLVGGKLYYFL